jgi:hypothetical protein
MEFEFKIYFKFVFTPKQNLFILKCYAILPISQFDETCNSHFGFFFEAALLRIYWVLPTLGRWHAGSITTAINFFGRKFWQSNGMSAQQFIYRGSRWHENLMARVEQSKVLSDKGKPIAFLFKATKASETTK